MTNTVNAWFDRAVINAVGPDSLSYLQGQLSADIAALAVGGSTWSLLLAPTGKMLAWIRVTRTAEESLLIDLEPEVAEAALARLNRFKLRVSAELTLEPTWSMLSVRAAQEGEFTPPELPETAIALPAPGATIGTGGVDILVTDRSEISLDGLGLTDPDAIERYRITHGIPRNGVEIDDDVIPGELGAWLIEESVSWTKGCYTGQELVARVDSRGNNTPRHLSILTLQDPSASVSVDSEVSDSAGATVGRVSSAAGASALALVKRSVEPGDRVTVGGVNAVVERVNAQQ